MAANEEALSATISRKPHTMHTRFNRQLPTVLSSAWLAVLVAATAGGANRGQSSFPKPPNDLTRVYYLGADQVLMPLPFEPGVTSLNVFVPAKRDAIVRVVLKGSAAATVLANNNPRFYVFVADKMDPPPHQLVRLTSQRSARELRVSLIKGRKGYAPFASENVSLEHRILERLQVETSKGRYIFVNYMQIRPLTTLPPGEYAIIGDSLADMATFRIQ
jgi:hypothetical protein